MSSLRLTLWHFRLRFDTGRAMRSYAVRDWWTFR